MDSECWNVIQNDDVVAVKGSALNEGFLFDFKRQISEQKQVCSISRTFQSGDLSQHAELEGLCEDT